ncbi:hypothetical protein PHYBLDRAFT_139687 [Phycomyces blakesleeanus NRRL 1555(-)]|uniref:Uncharacterized protein n=1 Tax=Phycomyces blakesleeanus (strain ATCC 8743b / DSM 1359 / FGSC 10004 / NBRC 33097 / NRRL 1555) TaxID=763407 RepID=A0A162YC72_PHYB8|nr:hypothetical protein PHYBLDRAFT_139687 [Phycomyces blakesleeanus NRRL 1555(-)]OAD79655.1 hypothetical protein PHYBLDRAFT_139687 [Phycomyces blakesleeanus NRRL 1555(-)]|eukprot:XP_018297695.1 hypothetical protein PHYBLDRAFT_139687 [Phycomyces blakesleeanus NRRL 1555(-)]
MHNFPAEVDPTSPLRSSHNGYTQSISAHEQFSLTMVTTLGLSGSRLDPPLSLSLKGSLLLSGNLVILVSVSQPKPQRYTLIHVRTTPHLARQITAAKFEAGLQSISESDEGVWLAESTFVIAYFKAHMNKLCHTRAPFHNNDLPDILVNYALRLRVTQSSDKKTFLLDADLPEFKTNEALKHAILSHRAEVYNYASYCDGIVCSRALLSRPINKPIKKKIGLQFEAMQNNDPYKSSVYGATKSHLPFSKDNLISVSTPLRAYHIEAERQRRKLENKLHREYFWECQISSYGLTGHPDHIEEPEDPESSSDDTDPFQKDFYILLVHRPCQFD